MRRQAAVHICCPAPISPQNLFSAASSSLPSPHWVVTMPHSQVVRGRQVGVPAAAFALVTALLLQCAAASGCGTHTIKAGDTFWGLAQAKGFTVDAILAANPGVVPERLAVGQVVNLPCSGSGAAVNGNQATGCPAGWLPAVGSMFDSWPKPGTRECVEFSGCKWAGLFSRLSAGPLFSEQPVCSDASCNSSTDWKGDFYKGECLAGDRGSLEIACRWPEAAVRDWKVAATWDGDTALLDKTLEVMVQGGAGRIARVRVMDVCNDNDCGGCCSKNTAQGAHKLIDLEKWAALDLLGSFDPNAPRFDINDVPKPTAGSLRQGAEHMMPLCYRFV